MFEGAKTFIFWIGLIILALASTLLFTILWYTAVNPYTQWWKYTVPPVIGSIIFILIGFYMMKSGIETQEVKET